MLRWIVEFFWVGATLTALAAGPGEAQEARNVVERFHETLISVMRHAEELGYQGRYERLAPAISGSHDLHAIGRIAAGRYWRDLRPAQRELLVETFSQWSIATYAHRFDGYSGEVFKTEFARRLGESEALVRTFLIKSDGDELRFDYYLHRDDGQWRIINILVDGVSNLAIRRSEYASIIESEGFSALIDKIREKIAHYSQSTPQ